MQTGEFHNRDGWYFSRLADGAVRIRKTVSGHEASVTEAEHTIPPNEWASIIAWVAANGGTGGNYAAAEAFHAGHTFAPRGGDALVLAGAADAEEERARKAAENGEPGVAEVARTNAADLRDIWRRIA